MASDATSFVSLIFFRLGKRLSGDLERVQKEKQSTEQQLKEELADVPDKQQDCDKRLLEAKLKVILFLLFFGYFSNFCH